ncbi:hypothetical protein [Photobacterium sp. R1]
MKRCTYIFIISAVLLGSEGAVADEFRCESLWHESIGLDVLTFINRGVLMKKFFLVLPLLFSSISMAETIDCEGITLDKVTVEGSRDDKHFFENKLVIKLIQSCGGKSYVHADLSHPAFNGFLSVALAAKAAERKVNISVNTSDTTELSNQVAYIGID